MTSVPWLSIVMPTLNEAANLARTIPHTLAAAGGAAELIISDCGSTDGTAEAARGLGAIVVEAGATSRAQALNAGAAAARGEVLLFLHADTLLPDFFPQLIRRALQSSAVVGGAFDFLWSDHPQNAGWNAACLRLVVMVNRARFRWTSNFYGDQAIYVRRDVHDAIGGFPNVRLMEDIRFSRQMKRRGRVAILRPPVRTSPRRFLANGVLRQFYRDLRLLAMESCGFDAGNLHHQYNRLNRSPH